MTLSQAAANREQEAAQNLRLKLGPFLRCYLRDTPVDELVRRRRLRDVRCIASTGRDPGADRRSMRRPRGARPPTPSPGRPSPSPR